MNPLAIRIAADLKAFKANMDQMRTQLETNASAMKRMSSAFDGSRAIGDANAMVKAIHEIGGASKLTDAEMRRVNGTVTEALAKYKALGRDAPPELLALRNATKQLDDSSSSLTGKLKGVAGALGLAFGATAVVAGIKSLVSNTFEYAETIKDTSAKLGISMEATQRYKFAAEQTGASLENVSKSVLKLSQGLAGGDKGLKEALTVAGLEFDKVRAMKPEDAFNAVAAAVMKIPDPMLQAKLMLELYGKAGVELLPALREGFLKLADGVKTMSDDTIRRLDDAKDAWEAFGNTVTIVTGEMLSDTFAGVQDVTTIIGNFGQIFNAWREGGVDAALRLTGELGRFKDAIYALTDAQKKEVDQLLKNGIPANQIYDKSLGKNEASVMAYIASLKKSGPALKQFGEDNKKAAKVVKESWSGTFTNDLFNFGEAIQKQIDAGIIAGAGETLEELLARRWKLGKSFTDGDFWASYARLIQADIDAGIISAPGETLEQLLARRWGMGKSFSGTFSDLDETFRKIFGDAGDKAASGFIASFTKAMEGLGSVIVGAIQGGGDVGRSAFAHLGQSLGSDLGGWIAKGIGGSLGKALGSFAGPLGALLGSSVGGLIDKLFGKNQGRDDAKSFASMFGGFDALREKMLVLGAEGDKLWIALTQNTKGPAQVAQAIKAIEDALAKAEAAAVKAGSAIEDTFKGPEGARGFPTRAQLQKAASDAKAAYDYMAASGEYTADVLTDAWNQWQDAMIASGDETAKRMKELQSEILSLQKAVEAETPEYDINGVRMYGVEELRNIERLAALEAEKAALNLAQIAKEEHATVEAAKAADLQATKEFEAAKLRALDLDGYLRKLFTGGYEIPITFRLPGGVPGGGSLPGSAPSSFGGASMPASSGGTATSHITVVIPMDGEVVAQKTVKYTAKLLPNELKFVGASQ